MSGRIQAFFTSDDEEMVGRWLNNDSIGIRLRGDMPDGVQYAEFTFPAANVTSSPIAQVPGRGTARVDWSFEAMIDASVGYDIGWTIVNLEDGVSSGAVSRP